MTTFHVVDAPLEREGAAEEAWAHVMQGCALALEVEGVAPDERDRLVRCHRLAGIKAGRAHLALADRVG